MQANVEKQRHVVHRIFSNTLGRALDASGVVGDLATGKNRKRR